MPKPAPTSSRRSSAPSTPARAGKRGPVRPGSTKGSAKGRSRDGGPGRGSERRPSRGPAGGRDDRQPDAGPRGRGDAKPRRSSSAKGASPGTGARSGKGPAAARRASERSWGAAGDRRAAGGRGATRAADGREARRQEEGPKHWGALARRGGSVVRSEATPVSRPPKRARVRPQPVEEAARALRGAAHEHAEGDERAPRPRPDKPRVASLPPVTSRSAAPSRAKPRKSRVDTPRAPLPPRPAPIEDLGAALTRAVGARRAPRLRADLDAAARAYEADRYTDALRLTRQLVQLAPTIPEIQELHGLVLYRLGRWREAITHLETFRELSGTAEQNHVLADAYRALRRWTDVEELWDELRAVSPNAEVVNEGRLVVAGSYADRGDLPGAIRLLEKGWRIPPRPQVHHLRRAYALADLYERSGQTVRARELFRWVMDVDREFADVVERVRTLG